MIAVIKISGDKMTKKKGLNFSPEFRLETAQLVVDQGYTHKEAVEAICRVAPHRARSSRTCGFSVIHQEAHKPQPTLYSIIETAKANGLMLFDYPMTGLTFAQKTAGLMRPELCVDTVACF